MAKRAANVDFRFPILVRASAYVQNTACTVYVCVRARAHKRVFVRVCARYISLHSMNQTRTHYLQNVHSIIPYSQIGYRDILFYGTDFTILLRYFFLTVRATYEQVNETCLS